jgi:hypothetical protein
MKIILIASLVFLLYACFGVIGMMLTANYYDDQEFPEG